ncbi:16S rRNA (guanine(966)-N(2))-methyltransferase RsmD [Leptolyngbya sp. 'hensonii']|uniref:16S rRNA (guanine(966)-N(2))-methyltransferase RsmD n=1 Tax=Leptolyngbya sp. 'hensonii' TaxID=1922337 RepID=UPI00094FAA83|nr:16S rRNA (guanine(966)-N(2))-methyltransferase RsmD [Leptolyngbya sp. 'hensonii']OLP16762.1 16S rRNA (guanine(966)-N(2))-methyltransferase RsmD [Leptolyngbya sp. 'hensonii']
MSLRIYGNRQLKTLPGQATRPTLARVRAALFNIWQGHLTGCRWLDLCAGSGAMGAEALCRGAAFVVGIELSGRACEVIRQNWQQVAQPDQSFQIIRGDVIKTLSGLAGQSFDRIYLDPPYASDLYQPVLTTIATLQLLSPQGEIAIEHDPSHLPVEPIAGLQICRQKTYGNTALTFYEVCPQLEGLLPSGSSDP